MAHQRWTTAAVVLVLAALAAAEPVVATAPAIRPTSQPTSRPASHPTTRPAPPELLRDAIDPYHPGAERIRFFRAAGKDSELTEAEYKKTAATEDSFSRAFDRWDVLIAYDKDGNGKVNWFEADAYRRGFRELALATFDANKDLKLRGEERRDANQALADGKLVPKKPVRPKIEPLVVAAPPDTQPAPPVAALPGGGGGPAPEAPGAGENPPDGERQRMMARFDTDEDGEISEAERQAMIESFRQGRGGQGDTSRYDANGDGELNETERAAMEEARRERRWTRRFDRNGDGVLDDAEQTEADVTTTQMRSFREIGERYVFDLDGDGTITDDERRRGMLEIGRQFGQMRREMESMVDADGDGQITAEERDAFGRRMTDNWRARVSGFTVEFDVNGDGKLDTDEREKMKTGIRDDTARRFADYDEDGDGRLNADERSKMMKDWVQEMTGGRR